MHDHNSKAHHATNHLHLRWASLQTHIPRTLSTSSAPLTQSHITQTTAFQKPPAQTLQSTDSRNHRAHSLPLINPSTAEVDRTICRKNGSLTYLPSPSSDEDGPLPLLTWAPKTFANAGERAPRNQHILLLPVVRRCASVLCCAVGFLLAHLFVGWLLGLEVQVIC